MKKSCFLPIIFSILLAACSSTPTIKRLPPAPSKPDAGQTSQKDGGYYPGDGPHANPPSNLDAIPDAVPKQEALFPNSLKSYVALGKEYTPLQSAKNYKKRGVASWYGKLFHGNKTAMGETYDMYSMTAAHTILPLPTYVKVTNLENGRSVIVRVNDRGPFKHEREIDLSYAAAHKLRLIEKGSGMVEVEAIDPETYQPTSVATQAPPPPAAPPAPNQANTVEANTEQHYIQAGAFSNESNALNLQRRIETLYIEQAAKINRVYNDGLHRLLVGPYQTRQKAEQIAASIRQQLNISTIITTK